MTEFARQGWRSIFLENGGGRAGRWEIEENLYVVRKHQYKDLLVPPVVMWAGWPGTVKDWLNKLTPDLFVYDCLDDASEEFAAWRKDMPFTRERADIIFTTSKKLYHINSEEYRHKVHMLPNGVNYQHFVQTGHPKPEIYDERPVLLYVGAVAPWTDIKLVSEVALRLPSWHVVIIGPHFGKVRRVAAKNITWMGYIPYAELPPYYEHASVAIAPFRVSEMLQGCDACKNYEYMAAGLPVVGTPINEHLSKHPYIVTAGGPVEFARLVKDVLKTKNEMREMRQSFAAQNTWTIRAQYALDVLQKRLS